MPVLKNLTLTALPTRRHDPVAIRRAKLIERLEDQKRLLAEPNYVRTVQRWTGEGDQRRQVEKQQKVRPWWRLDGSGHVVFALYHGAKPIEFEKGKAAVSVPASDKLPSVIDTLIKAVAAGELDEPLNATGQFGRPAPSGRKAA